MKGQNLANDEGKVWEACEDTVLRTDPTQDQSSPTQTSSAKQTGKLRQIILSSGSQNVVCKPAAASVPENLLEIWVLTLSHREEPGDLSFLLLLLFV